MTAPPRVACLMPTYNRCPARQVLVEEALHSFLIQDYEDAELLICNDCPGQELVFAHPRVRLFNLPGRFASLGDKLNWMVGRTRAELVCRFDDDDVSLPWRVRWCVERLDEARAEYFTPGTFWGTNDYDPERPETGFSGGAPQQSMFRRDAFLELGGYPDISFGEDAALEDAFVACGRRVVSGDATPEEAAYVYRWGTGAEHLSGYGAQGRGWDRIGSTAVEGGTFHLRPHWREDYVARVRARIPEAEAAAGSDA